MGIILIIARELAPPIIQSFIATTIFRILDPHVPYKVKYVISFAFYSAVGHLIVSIMIIF